MSSTLIRLKLLATKISGGFPDTEKLEEKEQNLRKEYEDFTAFESSEELKLYQNLKQWAESDEPLKEKKQLERLAYKGSEEHKLELELASLSKNKALKNYLKLKDTDTLRFFEEFKQSGKHEEFQSLEAFVNSTDYKANRKNFKKDNSPEYQKEIAYNQLKNDTSLKRYTKLLKQADLKDYYSIKESDTLKRYLEVKSYVESDEFKKKKEYLQSKNKFDQTESFKKLQEYNTIKNSEKVKWFYKVKDSSKFDKLKQWELTFADDFEDKSLDHSKWIPRYFWGEAILNKGYSMANESHCYTEGQNLKLDNSKLTIETRREKANGLAWDAKFGFVPKAFDYTSGIISTGNYFRQKHGKFEAKVRFSDTKGIYHAFWLVGDTMLPEVDVFRKRGDKQNIQGAFFWQNGEPNKHKKSIADVSVDLSKKYYILSIEWTDKQITWFVNGIPFKEQTNNLPDAPLYVVLSSGVTKDVTDISLPATLDVDWVRCWKRVH
ncbi:MAG: family 16 glycosylhydrolase [Bacteroidales bacterium]|nr:family 16 glycosylhydrolase [Bacteroidales bacterium]MBN2748659.1 family 16 glycosylhydrolase [Bacteroidales bacterium]